MNGYYEDKILQVATMILPPGEEYKDSRPFFGNINYFGGLSTTALRESPNLKEYLVRNPHNMILLFSDVWLDHPLVRFLYLLCFIILIHNHLGCRCLIN